AAQVAAPPERGPEPLVRGRDPRWRRGRARLLAGRRGGPGVRGRGRHLRPGHGSRLLGAALPEPPRVAAPVARLVGGPAAVARARARAAPERLRRAPALARRGV